MERAGSKPRNSVPNTSTICGFCAYLARIGYSEHARFDFGLCGMRRLRSDPPSSDNRRAGVLFVLFPSTVVGLDFAFGLFGKRGKFGRTLPKILIAARKGYRSG